jgi:hypothetical protein
MHAGVELRRLAWLAVAVEAGRAHHDSLALVLEDVARATDFIAAAEAEEHELVGGIYGVVVLGPHGRELPFGRHGRESVAYNALAVSMLACDRAGPSPGAWSRVADASGGEQRATRATRATRAAR